MDFEVLTLRTIYTFLKDIFADVANFRLKITKPGANFPTLSEKCVGSLTARQYGGVEAFCLSSLFETTKTVKICRCVAKAAHSIPLSGLRP